MLLKESINCGVVYSASFEWISLYVVVTVGLEKKLSIHEQESDIWSLVWLERT